MTSKFTFLVFSNDGEMGMHTYFANGSNDALERFHQDFFKGKPYLVNKNGEGEIEKIIMIPGEQVDVSNKLRNKTQQSMKQPAEVEPKKHNSSEGEYCPVCFAFPMTRSCPDKCEVDEK